MRRLSQPTLICLALALAVGVLFYPVHGYNYINLDDPGYVTDNPHLAGGLTFANMRWAITGSQAGFWHPLTWLSHMLDVQLFGPGPTGPHLVNVAIHMASTVLLFLVLRSLTGTLWRAAIVAALFGWHPLRVETVAWVAERKDVLSGFFFVLTLGAYGWFVKTRVAPQRSGPYLFALICFGLGLLSKPMLVTLPFVLLLLDYWPLGRFATRGQLSPAQTFRHLLLEKIPFFVLAGIVCFTTVWTQKGRGAMMSLADCPLNMRLENAVVSYLRYVGKVFWPFDLATPYSDVQAWPLAVWWTAALVLILWSTVALVLARRHPFVVVGWFWFVGMLVPVSGILQAGAQSMADRFAYLPGIGLFILVVWGGTELAARVRLPMMLRVGTVGLALLACGMRTDDQLQHWQNSERLLTHTLAVTRNNWLAHYNLGWELDRQGRLDDAMEQYRQTLAINPRHVDALGNLGADLLKQKRYAEAAPFLEQALQLRPDRFDLQLLAGNARLWTSQYDEAIGHYQIVLTHDPQQVSVLKKLGVARGMKRDYAAASSNFQAVLQLQPEDAEAHFNLAEALLSLNKPVEARPHLMEALRLHPGWPEAQQELQSFDRVAHSPLTACLPRAKKFR